MDKLVIPLKPLSANEMYYGKKKVTNTYKAFRKQAAAMLPDASKLTVDFKKPIAIRVDAFFRRRNSDLDNIWKPLLDTLQEKYPEFNDNKVVKMEGYKHITKDDDGTGYVIHIKNTLEPIIGGGK